MSGLTFGLRTTWLSARHAADVGPADAVLAGDALAHVVQLVLSHGGRMGRTSAQGFDARFEPGSALAEPAERALRCAQALLAHADASIASGRNPRSGASWRLGVHAAPIDCADKVDPALVARQAATIARSAPPGRLCVSHEAFSPSRRLFEVEPPQPLAVEGWSEHLQTFLLRDAIRQPPGGAGARTAESQTPLVGRQDELHALQAAFEHVAGGGRASALTVLAAPGVGKSRLLREFDDWARARPVPAHFLHARAMPQTQTQPYGLLGRLLTAFCQVDVDAPTDAARARFEAAIAPWFAQERGADGGDAQAHLLGFLIGFDLAGSRHLQGIRDDPAQVRQRALLALEHLFRRLGAAGRAPLLLQLEDLHWADAESLDAFDHLLQAEPGLPMLIVATSRPELADRRPAWTVTNGARQRLDLAAFDALRSRTLATRLLEWLPEIPRALLDLIVKDSDGHPYTIEERIRLLIDQGVILASGSHWTVDAARLRNADLPGTLRQVLQARLDLLPAAERRTLQRASIIGPEFGAEALQSLNRSASPSLPTLLRRELAMSLPAVGPGYLPSFHFKHQLLQQLVYDTVPRRTRRALHARFAAWLVAAMVPRAHELLGQSAHHFEQAGEDVRAAEQHARAAEYAQLRYASEAALDHVQRGLTLLDRLAPNPACRELRWRLLKARIRTMEVTGQRASHRADLDALVALADELADDTRRASAHLSATLFAMQTSDLSAMKASARLAMGCAARAGDDALRLHAMRYFASAHFGLGDWDAGQRLALQCLGQARQLGQRDVEAYCTNLLGIIATRQRDPVAALRWDEQTLTVWRELGDRSEEAISEGNLGESWLDLGEPTLARRHLEEGARLARACGNGLVVIDVLCNLSVLKRRLGQGERAVALAQMAIDAAAATGAVDFHATSLQRLGEAELTLGHHAAAASAFERIQALALQGHRSDVPDALGGLASVALARGDVPTALHLVLRVLELDGASAVALRSSNPRALALICHRVLSSAGDPRALAWLQRAHGELLSVAATISDEALRAGFFDNIPEHRAILAAWALHERELQAQAGTSAG